MPDNPEFSLLAAIRDFGWGSLGKLRLILDELPRTQVTLYGDAHITGLAKELLSSRHKFIEHPPQQSDVALVINEPVAANSICDFNVPVVFVESMPYMRWTDAEVPALDRVAYYCAQKYPIELLPLPSPLRKWPGITWIDPIVPTPRTRRGGRGIVVSVGGLYTPSAGNAVDAYLNLVLFPLVSALQASGRTVFAVCGNLSTDICRRLRTLLPECDAIGPQSPYAFERMLPDADLLITSPGSTTMLQAMSISLPTLLLPPQNRTQIFNARLYSKPDAHIMQWPASAVDVAKVEQLRPQGRDVVRRYIYQSIVDAAASQEVADEVATIIRRGIHNAPSDGVLNLELSTRLGSAGASQVAQLIKEVRFASHQTTCKEESY